MKILNILLLVLLLLTCIVPLKIAWLCIGDHTAAKEFFGLSTVDANTDKLMYVMSGFIIGSAAFQVLTIMLVWQRKMFGYNLAILCGALMVLRAKLNWFMIGIDGAAMKRIVLVPGFLGLLIIIMAWVLRAQMRKTNK